MKDQHCHIEISWIWAIQPLLFFHFENDNYITPASIPENNKSGGGGVGGGGSLRLDLGMGVRLEILN